MITTGTFYAVLRKPSFQAEANIANGDFKRLVEAQQYQKVFNDTISNYLINWGATCIEMNSFKVLECPLGVLDQIKTFQNSLPVTICLGIGSTMEGAYKALLLAEKKQTTLELYVAGKTEQDLGFAKSEDAPAPDMVQPPAFHENVEQALDAQIRAAGHKIQPDEFAGLVESFQMVLQNFKLNMASFESLQVTNPTAYASILDVVQASSQMAQMLLESGILNTDAAMMAQHQNDVQEQQQGDGEEEDPNAMGGSPDDDKAKASKNLPVGTVKRYASGWRIKTKDGGWKYVNRGLGRGEGGEIAAGTSAGVEKKPGH